MACRTVRRTRGVRVSTAVDNVQLQSVGGWRGSHSGGVIIVITLVYQADVQRCRIVARDWRQRRHQNGSAAQEADRRCERAVVRGWDPRPRRVVRCGAIGKAERHYFEGGRGQHRNALASTAELPRERVLASETSGGWRAAHLVAAR